jgi:hypothetical protein
MVEIQNTSRAAGTVTLTEAERDALRRFLAGQGWRAGSRALGLSRGTVTTAALGGTMRPSTAVAIRLALGVLIAQQEPTP